MLSGSLSLAPAFWAIAAAAIDAIAHTYPLMLQNDGQNTEAKAWELVLGNQSRLYLFRSLLRFHGSHTREKGVRSTENGTRDRMTWNQC